MQEKVNPILKKAEKRLIRKIARIHIRSLVRILNNEIDGEDVVTTCLQEDITEEQLLGATYESIQKFQDVILKPGEFFNMDDYERNVNVHILMDFFEHPKYETARRSIFRKMLYLEPIPKEIEFSLN